MDIGKWRRIRLNHISATGTVQTYLDCPLQFWFKKIAKFPDEDKKPWLIFGTAIHATQEFFLKEFSDTKKIGKTIESKMLEEYESSMIDSGSKYLPPKFWGREGLEGYQSKAKVLIKESIKRYKKMPIKPLIIEEELNVKYNDELHLTGKIDLVYEALKDFKINDINIDAGSIIINDHKTASQKYIDWKADISSQLTFYTLLYRECEMAIEDYVQFQVFLKYKEPIITDYLSKRDEVDIANMFELLDTIVSCINSGIFYPTLNTDVCKWCSFRQECKKYSSKQNRLNKEIELANLDGIKLEV